MTMTMTSTVPMTMTSIIPTSRRARVGVWGGQRIGSLERSATIRREYGQLELDNDWI